MVSPVLAGECQPIKKLVCFTPDWRIGYYLQKDSLAGTPFQPCQLNISYNQCQIPSTCEELGSAEDHLGEGQN